jgi:hypothetical protein
MAGRWPAAEWVRVQAGPAIPQANEPPGPIIPARVRTDRGRARPGQDRDGAAPAGSVPAQLLAALYRKMWPIAVGYAPVTFFASAAR